MTFLQNVLNWYIRQIRNTKGKAGKTVVGTLPLIPVCLFLSICQTLVTGGSRRDTASTRAGFANMPEVTMQLVAPSITPDPREVEPTATTRPTQTTAPTATAEPTMVPFPTEEPTATNVPPTVTPEPMATLEPTATEVPPPTATPGPPEGEATGALRMRSEPSTNGVQVGSLSQGVIVGLRYRSPDGGWLSVQKADGTVGWVSAEFMRVDPAVFERVEMASSDSAIVIPPMPEPAPVVEEPAGNCDPSYPDFCIPAGIADLDCPDVPYNDFTVYQPDPYRFDRDKDGIGCES